MTSTVQLDPVARIPAPVTPPRGRANIGFTDERRAVPRFRQRMIANVIGLGNDEVQACVTDDISEGGLFVQVPSAYGLCVGQRLEVELQDLADSGPRSALCGERRYATVVRTEPIKKGPSGAMTGAGLRFDQPLFI